MAVRRLHPDQPPHFAFTPENLAWADQLIANYPDGKQASAIIPLLWRAQEQSGGWLPEPAIRTVCDKLNMAYIRGLEVATFYTMFQLAPVGSKAHVQVCGTTPCMLNGARALVEVCQRRIAEHQHQLNADGSLSWEEVECLGNCANAPVVQVDKDTFEDLTPALLENVIDGFVMGKPPKAGSQIGRKASCPAGGPTTLSDATLFDGSVIGAWRKRFQEQATAPPVDNGAAKTVAAEPAASPAAPRLLPAALTAMANAGLVKELNERGTGKPLSADELERLKSDSTRNPMSAAFVGALANRPELLAAPRGGKGDDLALIWGVADRLTERLNAIGIWHFDQIAKWTPQNVNWFESQMDGFKGRVDRDKWIEQCQKLASGWRPDSDVGQRPKG
jgi:NADH-quinone oxidoreductase subunit E